MPPADAAKIISKIGTTCDSMGTMLRDMLDFTTSELGIEMPVRPAPANLEKVCQDVLNQICVTAPGRDFILEASGDMEGNWDAGRLQQLFSNFFANAVRYGAPETPIRVSLEGSAGEVSLAVHNHGNPIPAESLAILFDPMVRLADPENRPVCDDN